MNYTTISVITLLLLVLVFLLFYIIRMVSGLKKKLYSKDKDSTQVGFVVDTFHDLVSRLKEKEKELEILKKDAEERASSIEIYNENILQSVPSGVISFDREWRVTKMNFSAEKILGLREPDMLGRTLSEIFTPPVSDMIEKRKAVERAEIGYVAQSGKRIWLGLNVSPLRDASNNMIGQILVFTDLTELKAFQSQMELRERLSTLGEMSAGIAHELRNPMAVISGYTKILSKKADDTLIPAVQAISREVAVMDRIITDFLSFAKPTQPVISEVGLNELIAGCIEAVADHAGRVRIFNDTNMLPVIRADEVLLRQSIINLLQNAVESMPDGGELKISGSAGDYLTIAIADTGHGIPDSIKDKIFLPFYTTKERGTGLGLSIVHKIIVSHGGVIQVDTSERGTTFTIKLPADSIVLNKT